MSYSTLNHHAVRAAGGKSMSDMFGGRHAAPSPSRFAGASSILAAGGVKSRPRNLAGTLWSNRAAPRRAVQAAL